MTWVGGPKWLAEDVIEQLDCTDKTIGVLTLLGILQLYIGKVWRLQTYESCWTFLNIDTSINQYMFRWCSWIITLYLSVPFNLTILSHNHVYKNHFSHSKKKEHNIQNQHLQDLIISNPPKNPTR